CFFFQAEDGIRDFHVTGVQTCALPICPPRREAPLPSGGPQPLASGGGLRGGPAGPGPGPLHARQRLDPAGAGRARGARRDGRLRSEERREGERVVGDRSSSTTEARTTG